MPAASRALSSGSPYTPVANDEVLEITTGGSGYTVDLPAASAVAGRRLVVIKADSGAGAVTVTPNGGDTIDGASSLTISSQVR